MSVGQKIIDQIIAGQLCTARCAHDDQHGCVITWSGGAAEQIEAAALQGQIDPAPGYASAEEIIERRLAAVRRHIAQLRATGSGISASVEEIAERELSALLEDFQRSKSPEA